MDALDKIPSRIKYYLLDYKDNNTEDYQSQFGTKRLRDLNLNELHEFYSLATTKDAAKILK